MMLNSDNFGVMAFSISLVGAALLVGACRDRPDANVASTAFEVPGAMRKVQVDTGQEPGRKMIDISSAESLDALRQWMSTCRPIELIATYPAPCNVMHVTFLDGTRVDVAFSDPGTSYAILDLGGNTAWRQRCRAFLSYVSGLRKLKNAVSAIQVIFDRILRRKRK